MAKIAILSAYSGIVDRGVETFVYEIAKRLVKKHKVTVFASGQKKPDQKYSMVQIKVKIQTPQSPKGILGKLYLDWQSLKILIFTAKTIPIFIKDKFDVVFVLNGAWQAVLYRFISKLTGTKIIIPGAAGIGQDDAFNILIRPDVFVALTTSQAQWATKLSPEVKNVTIPNGVDLARFNPKISPKRIPLPKPIVVCTSALVPYKRVELTIKAVAKTKNLSLLVLGDGEVRGQIDSLGKKLLGARYLRLSVPYEDIPHYYRAGSVFTLASKTEAFGTSYIEAMACNLPVVTVTDDTREEIIGRAGILTDVTNIDQYAKDLTLATRTNYRNIPYDQALKFSWNKIALNYANLISNLLNEAPNQR